MPYMLAPGARLYVGNRGQMEESLGACCAPCARGQPCASLGAVDKAGNVPKPKPKMLTMQFRGGDANLNPILAAQSGGGLRGALPYVLGGVALLVGGAVILRNRKR